ncbi:unnamed protein product [Fraxinus pennsylvanica]|uniref:Uncharacterized protein n=1 Tax=Fraxinus pennsylvanica TaxID=56036 RepID=A0AAD2E9H2_9LAMI|nr:unnamed protein product [Fraxinus pennsylvanica]
MQTPTVSFKKPIGSVSVSGHKFVGCPMPCSVQIKKGNWRHAKSTEQYSRLRDHMMRSCSLLVTVNMAHTIVMSKVTVEKLDYFLNKPVKGRSIWYKDEKVRHPCLAEDTARDNCSCTLHK